MGECSEPKFLLKTHILIHAQTLFYNPNVHISPPSNKAGEASLKPEVRLSTTLSLEQTKREREGESRRLSLID